MKHFVLSALFVTGSFLLAMPSMAKEEEEATASHTEEPALQSNVGKEDANIMLRFNAGYMSCITQPTKKNQVQGINDGWIATLIIDANICDGVTVGYGLTYGQTDICGMKEANIGSHYLSWGVRLGGKEKLPIPNTYLFGAFELGHAYLISQHAYEGSNYRMNSWYVAYEMGVLYQWSKSWGIDVSWKINKLFSERFKHAGEVIASDQLVKICPDILTLGVAYSF